MNRILRAIVCAAALCASHSWAETWPARPITIIAPKDHLDLDSLDFDAAKMRAVMDLGVEAAKLLLA